MPSNRLLRQLHVRWGETRKVQPWVRRSDLRMGWRIGRFVTPGNRLIWFIGSPARGGGRRIDRGVRHSYGHQPSGKLASRACQKQR